MEPLEVEWGQTLAQAGHEDVEVGIDQDGAHLTGGVQRGILDEEAGRCIPRSRLGAVDPADPARAVLGDGEAGELLLKDDVGAGRQAHATANGPALGSL